MASAAAKRKEERKGGLPPIQLRAGEELVRASSSGWFGGAGSSGLFGANGLLGGGWSAGLAGLGGKVAVALLLCALGVGAFGVGRMLAPRDVDADVAAQRLNFDTPTAQSLSASHLPGNDPSVSAMQVIPESIDGLTPEQRAAAAAAAAAKAEADRKAKEAAEAAAKAAAQPAPDADKAAAPAAPPAADPFAAGNSPFKDKFGQLTQFGSAHSMLNGGLGMSQGVGALKEKGLSNGEAKAIEKSSTKKIAARASSRMPSGHSRGFAFRQLARANGLSRAGAAQTGETSSTLADSAFSNAPIGAGAITGGGAGTQDATGAGVQTSGGPTPATQNQVEGTQAPPAAQHKNSSPWQQVAMAGAAALAMGGMLLMVAAKTISAGREALKKAMAMPAVTPADQSAKAAAIAAAQQTIQQGQMMAMLAAAAGAAAAGVGALLWKQFHQKQFGMIFVAGGALLAVLAMVVMATGSDKSGQAASATNAATGAAGQTVAGGAGVSGPIGAGLGASASPAASASASPMLGVGTP